MDIKVCAARCNIVAGLPPGERELLLGERAANVYCGDMKTGPRGPVCGLPSGREKDALGSAARSLARTLSQAAVGAEAEIV